MFLLHELKWLLDKLRGHNSKCQFNRNTQTHTDACKPSLAREIPAYVSDCLAVSGLAYEKAVSV